MLPGLMSLDFCLDIQMVESEFGINRMRTWIHHFLLFFIIIIGSIGFSCHVFVWCAFSECGTFVG